MPHDVVAQLCLALIPLLIIAAGQALVMMGGGLDLSIPGMIAGSTMVGAWVMSVPSCPVGLAVAAMLASGALMGVINGLGVVHLRLPPAVVTLVTLSLFSGLALGSSSTISGPSLPAGMLMIGRNLPAWIGVALLAGLVVHLGLERLRFGRWLRAIGYHRESARAAGVPVGRVMIGTYVVSGLASAVVAVFYGTEAEGDPSPAPPSLLVDAIGAAVIGGVPFSGGRGNIGAVIGGAVIMGALGVLLVHSGLPPGPVTMLKAALVLVVAGLRARAGAKA
jgi:ribose transport system permease protein